MIIVSEIFSYDFHIIHSKFTTRRRLVVLKTVDVKFQVAGVGDEAELIEPLSALHCPPSRHQPQQASEAHIPRQWQSAAFNGISYAVAMSNRA